MSMIDKNLLLSNGQNVTNDAASESYIDQGAAGNAAGGSELTLVVRVGTVFDTCDSVTIALQTDSDAGFATALVEVASKTVLVAALLANTEVFVLKVPPTLKRYVRAYYTVNGSNNVSGTIDAYLVETSSLLAAQS